MKHLLLLLLALPIFAHAQHLTFEGGEGIGKGKHVVFISGDEEYRSEESCPMLAKILSKRYGFKTSVLFAINPDGGFVDQQYQKNIPGMESIATADLVVIGTRFRDLPDEQFQPFADYLNAGGPRATSNGRASGQTSSAKVGSTTTGSTRKKVPVASLRRSTATIRFSTESAPCSPSRMYTESIE